MRLDIDKVTLGWQFWLTPRHTRIIDAKLNGREIEPEDIDELIKLQEMFNHEATVQANRMKSN